MGNPENVARALNKSQRQALRRISRGQTIKRSMSADPVVKRFYTLDVPAPQHHGRHYTAPGPRP